jgi:polysaccharide chain length determinant protein (PEP-CTERM system associated)
MQNEFDYMKYVSLLIKHKRLFAVTALVIMTGAVVVSYVLPKKYEVHSTFFIEKNVLNDLLRGASARSDMDDAFKGLNYSIKSRSLFTKVINDLDLNLGNKSDAQLEAVIMGLQNSTDCKLNKDEGLVTISFTDKSPRFARDFVNALVRRYIEQNLSAKREESYGATTFISDQAASVKEKLDKVEAEIGNLRAKYGAALDVAPGTLQVETNSGQQRLDDLILRRSQLEATRNQLRNNNPAKSRIASLQRRLEELRVEYTDNYPEVMKVKADIEAAKQEANSGSTTVADPQELARIETELSAVRSSEANQRAFNNRGVIHANPAARTLLENLLQERTSYRTMYDQMMARQGQAEMSKQMAVQDKSTTFRVVDPAVMPLSPVSPNRLRIILMGIAAGIAGGFGLLLVIDYFDKTVKTVDTLKTLGINVLAVIPKITDPQAIEKEHRGDIRLYLVSGTYFSMILALLALEALNLSPVDRVIGLISG